MNVNFLAWIFTQRHFWNFGVFFALKIDIFFSFLRHSFYLSIFLSFFLSFWLKAPVIDACLSRWQVILKGPTVWMIMLWTITLFLFPSNLKREKFDRRQGALCNLSSLIEQLFDFLYFRFVPVAIFPVARFSFKCHKTNLSNKTFKLIKTYLNLTVKLN